MQNDTIFGKIIRGEVPATKVYEDERCLAFMDINPVSKGHLLLIPKEHYVWMQDVPDELLGYLFSKAKQIMKGQIEGLGCDFVQVVVEGKDVPHFHIHVIPTFLDQQSATWNHVQYEEDEVLLFAEKIITALK